MIHILAMLMKLDIYLSSSTSTLICHQDMWSDPSVDEMLYFLMVSLNFSLENKDHSNIDFIGTLSSKCTLIWQSWAELNVWWSACQRSSSLIYRHLLNYRASIASSLHFLIQFMRSQGLLFFDTISWILSSKKNLLVFLIKPLKSFQSTKDLEEQYTFSLTLYFSFYHALEHLVILIFFEYLYYRESEIDIYS